NANDYFDSLSREEQDKTFGKAGAQAIRDGADPAQVVNARSGMQPAGALLGKGAADAQRRMYGRELLVATSGTTRRGEFGRAEARRGGQFDRRAEELATRNTRTGPEVRRVRRGRAQRARLMP